MSSFSRYRIRFSKRGTVRFISHRDLMGVFARAFRRAELPVRMSQGFNPRPRFSLPLPLSVGLEGLDEVLELDLTDQVTPDDVARKLARELPDGIGIIRVELLETGEKARVTGARYRVLGKLPAGAAEECVASEELCATRQHGKEIDIRPYIKSVEACDGGYECEVLVTTEGTVRPAEIADALCRRDLHATRRLSLVRTAVNLAVPQ